MRGSDRSPRTRRSDRLVVVGGAVDEVATEGSPQDCATFSDEPESTLVRLRGGRLSGEAKSDNVDPPVS